MKLISLLAAVGVVAVTASPAYACSAPLCRQSYVFPSAGSVPANMVKLRFTPGSGWANLDAGSPTPRLFRLEGTNKVSVPFNRTAIDAHSEWLEPMESLPVGTTLLVESDAPPTCGIDGTPLQSTYTISEAKPLPTALGTLSSTVTRGTISVASSGPCSEQVDVSYADLRVQLPAEAQPYAALFAYKTFVDGALLDRWSSSLSMGEVKPQGEERVFSTCKRTLGVPQSVAPGTHAVRFEGTLPDGTKLSTPEISVTLRCDDSDAGLPDAGPPSRDASVSNPDAGLAGGVDSGLPISGGGDDDDGCSLASSRSGFSGLLLALALLLRRRKSST